MHTLCLLDIKVKEPDIEVMCHDHSVFLLPPHFMTVNQALEQLIEIEEKLQKGAYTKGTMCVGMARSACACADAPTSVGFVSMCKVP